MNFYAEKDLDYCVENLSDDSDLDYDFTETEPFLLDSINVFHKIAKRH
jgi:hypothetical protein